METRQGTEVKSLRVAAWMASLSLVVLAAATVRLAIDSQRSEDIHSLTAHELVWCDANRAMVALAAGTLGLLPDEVLTQELNFSSRVDTSEEPVTALVAFRALREEFLHTPPAQGEGLEYVSGDNREVLTLMGVRSTSQVSRIVDDWVGGLDGGWRHVDARSACAAAYEAFR